MIRAHEELCEMLGIGANDPNRSHRSRSVIGTSRDDSEMLLSPYESRPISNLSSGRPASLPGPSHLSEVYNSMTADVSELFPQLCDKCILR